MIDLDVSKPLHLSKRMQTIHANIVGLRTSTLLDLGQNKGLFEKLWKVQ